MTKRQRCAFHPALPADTPCERCGRLFCADCVRDWNGRALGPVCRRARIRRRVTIGAIVALMLSAPVAVILWGFDQRRKLGPDRHRIRFRERLLGRYPNATETRLRQARSLIRAGRLGRAEKELDRILGDHPRHLGGLLERARLAQRRHRHDQVLRWAGRAAIVAPGSVTARMLLARAHLALHRPDKAEATLRAGLKRNPRAVELTLMLADLLYRSVGVHAELGGTIWMELMASFL